MSKVLSSSLILVIKEHKLEPIVTGLNSDHLNTNYGVENGRDKRNTDKQLEVSQTGSGCELCCTSSKTMSTNSS
jgi:hypothetical protein